jgi:cysteinyl-tRNA synthetase
MRAQRWVSLDVETDDKLREKANQEGRSISNLLKYIITKFFNES